VLKGIVHDVNASGGSIEFHGIAGKVRITPGTRIALKRGASVEELERRSE
jgi:hypothetical protein